jgi:hypothetical protein
MPIRNVEVQIKDNKEGLAVTVPPPKVVIQANADGYVGVRMKVTPDIAAEWLETRGNNRNVKQSVVDRYKEDMLNGRWVFNGQSIAFDEEGKLLNGQHRLWAVVESGTTQEWVIQFGIPRETQATIDSGSIWQPKDILKMQGESNCAVLQAALAWIHREEGGNIMATRGMSNSVAMEILGRNPNIRRSVSFLVSHTRSVLAPSTEVYLHYRFASVNEEKANEFFLRLADGAGLPVDSPVYRLRERLLRHHGSKEKLSRIDMMAFTIIAWNYFYSGQTVKSLLWRRSGETAMAFPIIAQLPGAAAAKRIIPRRTKKDTLTHGTKRDLRGKKRGQTKTPILLVG